MKHVLLVGRNSEGWKGASKICEGLEYPDTKFYYSDTIKDAKSMMERERISSFDLVVQLNAKKPHAKYGKISDCIDESGINGIGRLCSDKFAVHTLLQGKDVLQPKTRKLTSIKNLEGVLDEFDSEFVFVKPNKGSLSYHAHKRSKSYLRENRVKVRKLLEEHKDGGMLISEYIPGHTREYQQGSLNLTARLFFTPIIRDGRYKGALYLSGVQTASQNSSQSGRVYSATRHVSNTFKSSSRNKRFLGKAVRAGENVIDALYSESGFGRLGPRIFGLDFRVGSRRRRFNPYFLEVNSAPLIVGWGNYKTDEKVIGDFKNRFIPEVYAYLQYLS